MHSVFCHLSIRTGMKTAICATVALLWDQTTRANLHSPHTSYINELKKARNQSSSLSSFILCFMAVGKQIFGELLRSQTVLPSLQRPVFTTTSRIKLLQVDCIPTDRAKDYK